MRNIPTLFVRDPGDMRHVTTVVHPDCTWVLAGEGVPTRKYDGTCVMLDEHGTWWARREVKPGKTPPPNYVAIDHDEVTGKTVGWEPVEQSAFAKLHAEALDPLLGFGQIIAMQVPDYLLGLREDGVEGIVWHHPDGRMAKLKGRDFA